MGELLMNFTKVLITHSIHHFRGITLNYLRKFQYIRKLQLHNYIFYKFYSHQTYLLIWKVCFKNWTEFEQTEM